MASRPLAFVAPRQMLDRKPPHGSPCNGCGLCCVATTCKLGQHLFKQERGPCPALVHNGDLTYACGVVRSPLHYMKASATNVSEMRDAALLIIGAADGCDARFNGEWINHDFHRRQNKIDRERASEMRKARDLWKMS